MFRFIFCICIINRVLGAFPTPSANFSRSEVLVADKYQLLWSIADENITVEVQVLTTGWVAFGLSPNGDMKGSDVVIGWVKNGNPEFLDCFAEQQAKPTIDKSQDWHLLSATETSTHTSMKFTRQLTNCDQSDANVKFDDSYVVYAWNEQDPTSKDAILKHSQRGTKMINLMEETSSIPIPPNAVQFNFSANNLSVPAFKTVYYVELIAVPQEVLNTEHYVIRMEHDVIPGNKDIVHHLVIYECMDAVNTAWDRLGWIEEPKNQPRPAAIPDWVRSACFKGLLYAWAVGGKPFVLPSDVGIKFGGAGYAKMLMLELHYDNPNLIQGRVDTSGIKIWAVTQPRLNTAGLLFVGMLNRDSDEIIPPKQDLFYHFGICPSECLKKKMQAAGLSDITLFAMMQHSHLAGRTMRTRHFRDGAEIKLILDEPAYDFDFQQTRMLQKRVQILPTDDIVIECGLKTKGRDVVTVGGSDSLEEMCMDFVYYYPYTPYLGFCLSSTGAEAIAATLSGYTNGSNTPPGYLYHEATNAWRTYDDVIRDPTTWDEITVSKLQTVYQNFAPQTVCTNEIIRATNKKHISLPDTKKVFCMEEMTTTVGSTVASSSVSVVKEITITTLVAFLALYYSI